MRCAELGSATSQVRRVLCHRLTDHALTLPVMQRWPQGSPLPVCLPCWCQTMLLMAISEDGSSIVVRSPGSRPSATACNARRSSLPLRVLGSAVTIMTRAGRATAPRSPSTWRMISCSIFLMPSGVSRPSEDLAVTKASATCPLTSSATPTTAASATLGCAAMLSSISRVPRRWPATLITSSVRPRMK